MVLGTKSMEEIKAIKEKTKCKNNAIYISIIIIITYNKYEQNAVKKTHYKTNKIITPKRN